MSAGNVNEKGMLVLFTTLETILQCFPKDGPGLLQPALQQLLSITLSGESGNLTVTSKSNNTTLPGYTKRPSGTACQCQSLHGASRFAAWSNTDQCDGMLL